MAAASCKVLKKFYAKNELHVSMRSGWQLGGSGISIRGGRRVLQRLELLEMADGLRDMTEALRVAEQAVGNLLERNEEVIVLGTC